LLLFKNSISQITETKFNLFYSFASVTLLSLIIILLINYTSSKIIYILSALALGILLSFNIQSILFFLLLIVVTPKFAQIHHSILFVLFLVPTAILNYKLFSNNRFKNPLIKPLVFFVLLASLSLINAPKNIFTFFEYFNIVAICLLVVLLPYLLNDYAKITRLFYFFILFMTIHSLIVISQAVITNGRAFGLLGVFYIDFAGLAFLYSIIFFIYEHGSQKFLFGLLSFLNLIGLIFSQTRNAWLSTVLMLVVLLSLLFFNNQKFFASKKFIIRASVLISLIFIFFFSILLQSSNVDVGKRLDTKNQEVRLTDNTESVNENSFVARLFIWHTAINAFVKEPIIGIGLYSFKYTTHKYYTIPKPFYKQFVEFKTPHVAYLEILVETGIIGFIGFIYFLFVVIKVSLKMIRSSVDMQKIIPRLAILISIFYIIVSMIMTEAWLYGQYLVWFGIILGALISDYKITCVQKSIEDESR
jgi:O-antigen ligase